MAVALTFNTAKSQVISLLQASRTAYATTVDSSKRQYASDTEIADAILFADGEVCTAIVQTPGHPFSNAFKLTSSALVTGDTLPSFLGRILTVTHCATSNGTYLQGIQANSREDILEMITYGTVYGTAAYTLDYYFVEDSILYIVDAYGKVVYTDYVRTASPQAPESYASAVAFGAVARLLKDGGDLQQASYYGNIFQNQLAEIRGGAKILPEIDNE